MNEHLALDSGSYLYEQPTCINCSVVGSFPEKLTWCLMELSKYFSISGYIATIIIGKEKQIIYRDI